MSIHPPSPPARTRVATPDGVIRVRAMGHGPPVLCLHGLSAHSGIWEALARRLEGDFRLLLPDLLGRGRSDPAPDADYSLAREAGRVRRLAAALDPGAGGYLAVGHSQGAALALALAAADSGEGPRPPGGPGGKDDGPPRPFPRPRGLVLVCPVTPWTRRPPALELLRSAALRRGLAPLLARFRRPLCRWVLERRAFGDPSRVDVRTVERYAGPYRDPQRARALLKSLADWRPGDVRRHLPSSTPPAVVLAGGRDGRAPPRQARRWAGELDAGFRALPDAGHALPEERPEALAEAVRAVHERATGRRG